MLDLKSSLKYRLTFLKSKVNSGVIPGVTDTLELQQIIGRVKELEKVIGMMEKQDNEAI